MKIEYELDVVITSIDIGGAWILKEITSGGVCTLKQTSGDIYKTRCITELVDFFKKTNKNDCSFKVVTGNTVQKIF